jgi:hypothetical protein
LVWDAPYHWFSVFKFEDIGGILKIAGLNKEAVTVEMSDSVRILAIPRAMLLDSEDSWSEFLARVASLEFRKKLGFPKVEFERFIRKALPGVARMLDENERKRPSDPLETEKEELTDLLSEIELRN